MSRFILWLCCLGLLVSVGAQPGAPVVSMAVSEKVVRPGKPVTLRFQVRQAGESLTDFDVVHEKTSHLILVSADYVDFQHVHPDLDAKGMFTIRDVVFTRPGPYHVFMDVTPQGSKQILKRFPLMVEGKAAPLVMREDRKNQQVGDVTIALKTDPARLKKGEAMLHFQLTRAGKPVTDITPFMGAMGHVIALGKNGAPFLHIHPMGSHGETHHATPGKAYGCPMHPEVTSDKPGLCPRCNMKLTKTDAPVPVAGPGEVIFHADFPTPGLYKVWGQFQVGPTMVIAPFTVKVD